MIVFLLAIIAATLLLGRKMVLSVLVGLIGVAVALAMLVGVGAALYYAPFDTFAELFVMGMFLFLFIYGIDHYLVTPWERRRGQTWDEALDGAPLYMRILPLTIMLLGVGYLLVANR